VGILVVSSSFSPTTPAAGSQMAGIRYAGSYLYQNVTLQQGMQYQLSFCASAVSSAGISGGFSIDLTVTMGGERVYSGSQSPSTTMTCYSVTHTSKLKYSNVTFINSYSGSQTYPSLLLDRVILTPLTTGSPSRYPSSNPSSGRWYTYPPLLYA